MWLALVHCGISAAKYCFCYLLHSNTALCTLYPTVHNLNYSALPRDIRVLVYDLSWCINHMSPPAMSLLMKYSVFLSDSLVAKFKKYWSVLHIILHKSDILYVMKWDGYTSDERISLLFLLRLLYLVTNRRISVSYCFMTIIMFNS